MVLTISCSFSLVKSESLRVKKYKKTIIGNFEKSCLQDIHPRKTIMVFLKKKLITVWIFLFATEEYQHICGGCIKLFRRNNFFKE